MMPAVEQVLGNATHPYFPQDLLFGKVHDMDDKAVAEPPEILGQPRVSVLGQALQVGEGRSLNVGPVRHAHHQRNWTPSHQASADAGAKAAGQSPRTFARHFRAATGATPLQWLAAERVRRAQELLEDSELPVEAVAERCGFGTAAGLRKHFGRRLGTTPQEYRRTFRSVSGPDLVAGERAASSTA